MLVARLSRRSNRRKYRIDPLSGVIQHLLGNVSVGIERGRDAAMTEQSLNLLRMRVVFEQQSGRGVPEVMKFRLRQPGFDERDFETVT